MPRIGQFLGITIAMYFNDQAPRTSHRAELQEDWERARQGFPPEPIAPLE